MHRVKASEIDIPEPCDEDWDRMTPAERGRFCSTCRTHVHDLSAMPESDARALLESDEDICISYLSNATGDVRFRPERIVPIHRLARRASVVTAAGLSLALSACAPHGDGPKIDDSAEPQRPAFLEFEPTIPNAEPCATQPQPQPGVTPQVEVAPETELPRRLGGRRAPAKTPKKTPKKLHRTTGTRTSAVPRVPERL